MRARKQRGRGIHRKQKHTATQSATTMESRDALKKKNEKGDARKEPKTTKQKVWGKRRAAKGKGKTKKNKKDKRQGCPGGTKLATCVSTGGTHHDDDGYA